MEKPKSRLTVSGPEGRLPYMTKAVLYARVSTKEQAEQGFSIEAQLAVLREYAEAHRLQIVREFVESESAGKEGRKAFYDMVSLLRCDQSVKIVLVEKTDRLYRNFHDYVLLEDLDLELHLVKEHEIISKDSHSHAKLIHGIKVVMAKNYLDNLSEEVTKGQRQKAQQGQYPGGALPIGYNRNRLTKQIEIDPIRGPIIRQLFEMYSEGDKSIDNLHEVAKKYLLTYPKSGRIMARSEIERILKKTFYTGKFTWNGVLYQGDHPPLVDPFLFEKVQNAFKKRSNGKFAIRDFTFGRLITCGECGHLVTAEIKKGKYVYYHCTGYGKKHRLQYIAESDLDRQFAQVVAQVSLPYDWYDYLKTCLEQELRHRKIQIARERKRLESQQAKIQTDMRKTLQTKLDGLLRDDFFKTVMDERQKELDAVNYRLTHLRETIDQNFDVALRTIELSHQAESLYLKATQDQKRKLLSTMLSNSRLMGTTLIPTYRKPFDILVKGLQSDNKRRGWDSRMGILAKSMICRKLRRFHCPVNG